jgi:hypothetical protein
MRKFLGKMDHSTSFHWLNRPDMTLEEKYAPDRLLGEMIETTESVYDHFLNCLPPLYMAYGGFLMSELTTEDITLCCLETQYRGVVRYFATHTRCERNDMTSNFREAYADMIQILDEQAAL